MDVEQEDLEALLRGLKALRDRPEWFHPGGVSHLAARAVEVLSFLRDQLPPPLQGQVCLDFTPLLDEAAPTDVTTEGRTLFCNFETETS